MTSKPGKPTGKIELSHKFLNTLKKRSQLSESEIQETFKEFREASTSGQLTEEEFIKLWNEATPQTDDSDSVEVGKRVFAFFDRDHSGKVDFNEFILASCLMTPGAPRQKLSLIARLEDTENILGLSVE
ncbi:unnamed protein product [Rotaria sordida]|uniref:EF-hand domain-containing protein n=1 Tax=Rotaria sordida TaxID=392033 RepID=A0A814BVP8_9BILA|nr:unnamed protein product [Rotaria sordida]